MTDPKNTANQRLTQIKGFLPSQTHDMKTSWDPDSTVFPTRKELPEIPGAPAGAAWFWGKDDYVYSLDFSLIETLY